MNPGPSARNRLPEPVTGPTSTTAPRTTSPASSQTSASASDDHRGRRPASLRVCVVSWVLFGITLLVSRLGASPMPRNPVAPAVSAVIDSLGESVAAPHHIWWWVSYLPVFGLVVLLLAGLLLLRQGWLRLVLVLLGLVAIVGYAQAGQWHIIPAVIFLLVGTAAGLMPAAHRYLKGTRTTATDTAAQR